jgi:hypothetical protein
VDERLGVDAKREECRWMTRNRSARKDLTWLRRMRDDETPHSAPPSVIHPLKAESRGYHPKTSERRGVAPPGDTTSHSSYSRTTQRHYADTLRSNGNTRILQNKSKSRRRPVQNPPSLSHSHSPVFMSCAKAPPLATNSSKDPSSATLPSPRQMTRSHRLIASTECVMNTVVRVYDMSAANSRQRVSPR